MEYVQRAVYGPEHKLSYMIHDKVHLSDGNKTLCGKKLNEMWFITGNEMQHSKEVTCKRCKSIKNHKNIDITP